jgi:uncharacterized protein
MRLNNLKGWSGHPLIDTFPRTTLIVVQTTSVHVYIPNAIKAAVMLLIINVKIMTTRVSRPCKAAEE